jgi:cysteine-rich repeat protein
MMPDGGRDAGRDAGRDGGGDPCVGRDLCDAAGTTCDGDNLVTCAEDADGCLVETRTDCGTSGDVCDASGATAACVDPCTLIPEADRCATDGERACNGETLEVCTMNANGCLVLDRTECDAAPGGVCDTSGAMPVCEIPADPCADIPAADRCSTAGASCDGSSLVECAPNAFGCLVVTRTDCTERPGGACDASGAVAQCTATDPCAGVTQCAAAGTRCDGPDLVTCAADAFGCLVETRTTCTDAPFGFCDADASPAPICSTAAIDPCMGVEQCGTESSRTCTDESTLSVCSPNAFGCFVTTTTSCTASSEVCSAESGIAMCVDPCSLIPTCPAASYCDGNAVVSCAPNAQGCLVETERSTCPFGPCGGPVSAPVCTDTICPSAAPEVITCSSGTITGNTADGANNRSSYIGCSGSTNYPGQERIYRFRHDGPTRVAVRIVATRLDGTDDFDLFAWSAGDGSTPCVGSDVSCLGSSLGFTETETVNFIAQPGARAYVGYDRFDTGGNTRFTLAVTCTPVVCGDSVITGDETCDDGNDVGGDGCSSTCQREPAWSCTGTPSMCTFQCGNGTIQSAAGETCDDGNTTPGDGCSAVCTREQGWGCTGTPSMCTFTCGNGTLQTGSGETCDDGNTASGDGCSPVCLVETGFSCFGTPSVCFPQAPNATCAGAETLTTAGVSGHHLRNGGPRPTGDSCGTTLGPVRYYSVAIPPGTAARVTATPTGTPAWDITLRTLANCSGACLSSINASTTVGVAETALLINSGATPVTRLIAVGANSSTLFGTFDLALTTEPLPANAQCSTATAITGDTTISAQNAQLGGARPTGTNCGGGTGATALYYAVTIPPGQRVRAQTTVPSGNDIVLFTQSACGEAACLSSTDSAPEQTTIDNSTDAPITRIIGIRPWGATSGASFSIAFTYTILPCGNGTIDAGETCDDGNRVAGDGCSAACAVENDFSCTTPGPSTCARRYARAPISAACVDMAGANVVTTTQGSADDGVGPITEAPFTFPLFGTTVSHYAVGTNGNVQLFTSDTGVRSNSAGNTALPNTAAPNGIIAPFWDDLVTSATAPMRVLGDASRLVVEWTNVTAFGTGTSDTLRFQAHVYPTGVVEVHYCAASSTAARFTGSSATIGLENLTGTAASQQSFDTAGAAVVGSGYRFTPVP